MKHFSSETAANLPCCLNFIRRAVHADDYNRMLYEFLLNHAPNEEHKNILTGIRNEEGVHRKLLCQLYFSLSGQALLPPKNAPASPPASYRDGLLHAWNRKKEAMIRSQEIARCLSNINQAMRMADIASEEMRHWLLYLYLYRELPSHRG